MLFLFISLILVVGALIVAFYRTPRRVTVSFRTVWKKVSVIHNGGELVLYDRNGNLIALSWLSFDPRITQKAVFLTFNINHGGCYE